MSELGEIFKSSKEIKCLQNLSKNGRIRKILLFEAGGAMLLVVDTLENADDIELIEDLYTKYKPWLKFRAHKIIDNLEDCEDLTHDCMAKMIRHVDTLRRLTEAQRRSYMAIAIDNISLNYSKRASRVAMMKDIDSADLEFIPDDYSVEKEIERKMDFEAILENIKYIPKRDQDIIRMRFELELSDEIIADILDIKKSSVRMSVNRSVAKLQREIEERRGL